MTSDIQKKIDTLQEYIEKLSSYVALSSDDLLKNEEKRLAMERLFLLMVDESIDINTALAYQLGGRIAESYKSSFHELVSLKLLEPGFAEKLAESAKTRNRLIHNYEKLSKADAINDMKLFFPFYQEYTRILIEKFISRK